MRHDAAYFRQQAEHCRSLAEDARDPVSLELLLRMAADFEDEARLLDEDQGPTMIETIPPQQ